jgi:LemA protein
MGILIAVLIIGAIIALFIISTKNGLIGARNGVTFAKGGLDAMLKKRFDLIPNLISTVQEYSKYEEGTLTKITELRSKGMGGNLSTEEQKEFNTQYATLGRNFLALSENYPDLKASANYIELQKSLNENEEQIAASRRTYNAAINHFNNKIQMFPGSMFAGGMQMFTMDTPTITNEEGQNVDVKKLFNN